jgi:hypothetical protein
MPPSPLLGPIVALVAWTLLILFYLAFVRFRGVRTAHLMEQPTLFYALVLALVLMGFDHPINVIMAWTYVGLRIAHSFVQIFYNDLRIRFPLFLLSTLVLTAMTLHAGLYLWH